MVHSWRLFLFFNCVISNFLYLSFSDLYSSFDTIVRAKLNKPAVSIKPLPKMQCAGGGGWGGGGYWGIDGNQKRLHINNRNVCGHFFFYLVLFSFIHSFPVSVSLSLFSFLSFSFSFILSAFFINYVNVTF